MPGRSVTDVVAPDLDPVGYRKALGRFPTGVAFVAARSSDGEAAGLLVNSFTSVSLDPPIILWCLGLQASSRRVFASSSTFAVSVLTEHQRALVNALGRPLDRRFDGVPTRHGIGDAPVIEAAAASFECSVVSVSRAGDHDIFLGQVERFQRCDEEPLAFLAGHFGRVHVAE